MIWNLSPPIMPYKFDKPKFSFPLLYLCDGPAIKYYAENSHFTVNNFINMTFINNNIANFDLKTFYKYS